MKQNPKRKEFGEPKLPTEAQMREVLDLYIGLHKNLHAILQNGDVMQKGFVINKMLELKPLMKDFIATIQEVRGVNFEMLNTFIENSQDDFAKKLKQEADNLRSLVQPLEPLMDKAKKEMGFKPRKRKRKSAIEKKWRSKD